MMQAEVAVKQSDIYWLAVTFCCVAALHLAELPFWIPLVFIAAVISRVMQYNGRLANANWPVKFMLVIACVGGIVLQFGKLLGLEPMLALLVSGSALKFLEMHTKRDAFVIICAGFFITAVVCLFSQSVFIFILVLACMVLLTASLVATQQSRGTALSALPFKIALGGIAMSIPLMLVLFLIMPRIGALWAMPGPEKQAVTGMGETMAPGDFTKLSLSADVAFRVNFEGDVPQQQNLYWRALVLSNFDGREWTHSGVDQGAVLLNKRSMESFLERVQYNGESTKYRIIMQPSHSRWLFTLAVPKIELGQQQFLTQAMTLLSRDKIHSRHSYTVNSWLDYKYQPDKLSTRQRNATLKLPAGFNPETEKIAKQWAEETQSVEQLIDRLLNYYNQSFTYTLEPPALGTHSVDEFLWQTRSGFCEHFSSSFVFFMRAAGVPARVVAGYQGGELHPDENFLTVRQYDAHAWAEVWIQNKGWVRVDPTAAVAPDRVESGYSDFFSEQDQFLNDADFSVAKYRRFDLINWLQLKMDSLDYAWAIWVLEYEVQQEALLRKMLGKIEPVRIALFLLVAAAISFLPLIIGFLMSQRKVRRDQLDISYLKFCHKMARIGLERKSGEAPQNYANRLKETYPSLSAPIDTITNLYIELRFADGDVIKLRDFKRAVAQFRPANLVGKQTT